MEPFEQMHYMPSDVHMVLFSFILLWLEYQFFVDSCALQFVICVDKMLDLKTHPT